MGNTVSTKELLNAVKRIRIMRTPTCIRHHFAYRPLAVAAAIVVLVGASLPAKAQVVSASGDVSPPFAAASSVNLTGQRIFLGFTNAGVGTSGSLSVTGGGSLTAAQIVPGIGGQGIGTVSVSGAGSVINLTGGASNNGLDIGSWGTGTVTVSNGGAIVCASTLACQFNDIGNAAGSTGTLAIDGGTVSGLGRLIVGAGRLAAGFGTPGAATSATLTITNGGTLTSTGFNGVAVTSTPTGLVTGNVTIDGAGSLWRITADPLDPASAVFLSTASHSNATATIDITGGGKMLIEGRAGGTNNGINLTQGGGSTAMTISGAGSELLYTGDAGFLRVGRSGAGGTASLNVENGGKVSGLQGLQVGRDGTTGTLRVNGAGSEVLVNGTMSAAADLAGGGTGIASPAYVVIGRGGGTGTVDVTNGGMLTLVGQIGSTPNGVALDVARDSTSSGTLNISGAGSVVSLSTASVVSGGGPTEAFNPLVRIGREGTGTLNITDGGKLLVDSQAVSTVADPRGSRIQIGGNNSASTGGTGTALVSGPGSEIRMTGIDTLIDVGRGAQSSGTLTVQNGASVSAIGMLVGNFGGTGTVNVNNAALNFSGQQTGEQLAGAFLTIGRGGGTGTVNVTNGGVVNLTNAGSAGAALTLGGSSIAPTGNGTLNVTDSTVNVTATGGTALFRVGRDGTGTATLTNSTVNVSGVGGATGSGSQVIIAALPGSTGTLTLNAGSVINTGYVGIGATPTGLPSGTYTPQNAGGTGTLILNNSTINTTTFEIGALGTLGGNGGEINASGDVIVGGTIGPGESPGRLRINCNLISLDGSRLILEIQDDGAGGFNVDQLIIGNDSTFDLAQFQIVFTFLGDTDPTAFAESGGFDLDNFLRAGSFDAEGNSLPASFDSALSTLFAAGDTWEDVVSFDRISAVSTVFDITSLSFDGASGGVGVVAAPIPEPSTWALMLTGFLFIAWRARTPRRSQSASTPQGLVTTCS
jgi:T5SS/PEP-CTERM-associated repeat protein